MINTLLGIKKGMTSTYDARGRRVGATMVEVSPNFVSQIKTASGKDGYNAIQLGFGTKKSVKKPQLGHLKKAGVEGSIRWFKEVRGETEGIEPGQVVSVGQVFSIGDAVKVTGVSKGKGFQGGVKKYNFRGGPKTHGQSDRHRAPGSIGSGTTPGRVYKGKKMAGRMGMEQVSLKGVEIVGIDKENSLLTLKGGIPGPVGGLIMIKKLGRVKGYTPPPEEKPEEEEEVEVRNDSENSENQNVGEPEKSDTSESSEVKGEKDNAN